MIIFLSPVALSNAREAAKAKGMAVQSFTQEMLESLFQADSAYLALKPIPPDDKLRAIRAFIDEILTKEFYGFKLLSKEEAKQAAYDFANPKNVEDLFGGKDAG